MPLHEPGRMSADVSDPGAALALWSALAPAPGPRSRQPVRATFIAALDGAVTVDGKSAGLGTPMDATVFQAMRSRAGLVLVGASTARTEGYGPATVHPSLAHLRTDPAPPAIWMLARTLREQDIAHVKAAQSPSRDDGSPNDRPAKSGALRIVTSAEGAPPELRERAASSRVALSVVPGPKSAFLSGALELAQRESGAEIDVEGGPHILAALLAHDLLDELVLSESPFLDSRGGARLIPEASGSEPGWRRRLRILSAFSSADGGLYTRWAVDKGDACGE